MTEKVKLYLDVDGVINAWHADKAWPSKNIGEATSRSGTYSIHWAPAMVAELMAMDLELVWATTWEQEAATSIAPLIGWSEAEKSRWLSLESVRENVKFGMLHTYGSIAWKNPAVRQDQEDSPSPFIWIDDEMGFQDMNMARDIGGLAIWSDPYRGIQPDDIEKMKQYIKDHS